MKTHGRLDSICVFIHDSQIFKFHPNVSINAEGIEVLSLEIIFKNAKNALFNIEYRLPPGQN